MIFSEACYSFSQKEQGSNKCCSRLREAQLCYGRGLEEVVDQHRKLITFELIILANNVSLVEPRKVCDSQQHP